MLALVGHQRSERELSLLADQTVVKRLERAEGVARVARESGARSIFHMAAQADVRKAIEAGAL